jgi:hypothetical protein
VISFKAKIISEKTILFETFNEIRELEAKIRGCITAYVQKLRAEETDKLSGESQARRSEDNTSQDVADSAATPLSNEGARFLREFIAKTERNGEKDPIDGVEVARFRLLASIVTAPDNDEGSLGVHDANLLFANRSALVLGYRELVGLINSGLLIST